MRICLPVRFTEARLSFETYFAARRISKLLLEQSSIIYYSESMEETINQRIKKLRKELKLTQNGFSSVITISAGQLACIETEKRVVNDRTIKLICDSFNVNDEWLRTGTGPVFIENKDTRYTKLIALYEVLKPKYQKFILNAINDFLKIQEEENS
jgi:transcriptional regulator with XRE-family HTH domain